ncbi:WXG100 family type VII secretion target [Nocardia sp. NPDC058497]|uniref:WXG100 family type VII secretion target n=1 Tax=Nocardia sp. NPDC058497 TaxID=3346529 RepID=UPI0036504BFE
MAGVVPETGVLDVNSVNVQEFGRFVFGIANDLKSGSSTVDREVTGLMATWRGSAADSYATDWNELCSGAAQVWEALFALAEKLGITAASFQEVDLSNSSGLRSLNIPELSMD